MGQWAFLCDFLRENANLIRAAEVGHRLHLDEQVVRFRAAASHGQGVYSAEVCEL